MSDRNPVMYLTAKMWRYSEGNRKKILQFSMMSIVSNSIGLLSPLIVAMVLNEIQKNGITKQNLVWLFSIMSLWLLREVGVWAFHGPSRVMESCNAFKARINYKMFLINGIFNLPLEWHAQHHTGDTNDKQSKGTEALFNYSNTFFMVLSASVRLVGSLLFLFYFDVISGLVAMCSIVIAFAIMARIDKVLVEQYRLLNKSENLISEKIHDAINNIATVIILRVDTQFLKSIRKKMMEPFELFRKNQKLNEWKWFTAAIFTKVAAIAIVGSYITKVAFSELTVSIGTVSALIGYSENFSELFYYFAEMFGELLRRRASVANSEELSCQFIGKKKTVELNGKSHWKELRIESLSFSYGKDKDTGLHLDNVSLKVRRGERIALVGETGSGKTTMLKILRDLYQPNEGSVYLDGEKLSGGISEISSSITLVPQDPEIFSTSILENITMGIDQDADQVVRFSKLAEFHEVTERLPRGYESLIAEKGVNLSGGEKQRLALARGLLACQDKTIVLMDEPTSSVDPVTEWRIFENILEEFAGKTVISSTHRLHLLPLFDSVYVFAGGKIVASGTFDQLVASSDIFKEMWLKCQAVKS